MKPTFLASTASNLDSLQYWPERIAIAVNEKAITSSIHLYRNPVVLRAALALALVI